MPLKSVRLGCSNGQIIQISFKKKISLALCSLVKICTLLLILGFRSPEMFLRLISWHVFPPRVDVFDHSEFSLSKSFLFIRRLLLIQAGIKAALGHFQDPQGLSVFEERDKEWRWAEHYCVLGAGRGSTYCLNQDPKLRSKILRDFGNSSGFDGSWFSKSWFYSNQPSSLALFNRYSLNLYPNECYYHHT